MDTGLRNKKVYKNLFHGRSKSIIFGNQADIIDSFNIQHMFLQNKASYKKQANPYTEKGPQMTLIWRNHKP